MATLAPPTTRSKPHSCAPRCPFRSEGAPRSPSPPHSSNLSSSAKFLLYDKSGEEHYNLISALHKSVRNSDPDAALYWLARMLESGEDPLYHRAPPRAHGQRRYRPRRTRRPRRHRRRHADAARFCRRSRRQSRARASRGLSFARAQIQCPLHRLWRSPRRRPQNRSRSRARFISATPSPAS